MSLARVKGLACAWVIYLPWLPGNIVGLCLGPIVLIHERAKNDRGTLIHELVHCRQFWRNGLILHFLRYWLSKPYRLQVELEAYRTELQCCSLYQREALLKACAIALASGYSLSINAHEAQSQLALAFSQPCPEFARPNR